jgi:hypothetical protein
MASRPREPRPPATVIVKREPAKRTVWPKNRLALLGKIPDRELAARTGVSPRTVANERKRRGIEPCFPAVDAIKWTPKMIALLGTASDRAVARELGISHRAAGEKRRMLGIPGFRPRPHHRQGFFWTPEDLALLGTMSDPELGELLGISHATVYLKRRRLGICPFQPKPVDVEWTEEMLGLLGKVPDAEVAQRYGLAIVTVYRKRSSLKIPAFLETGPVARTDEIGELLHLPSKEVHLRTGLAFTTIKHLRERWGIPGPKRIWQPEEIALLGKASDKEIAARLGCSVGSVHNKRRALRILSPNWTPGQSRSWRPEEIALLGTAADKEIAKRLGRSLASVQLKRHRSGIPSAKESKRQAR